MGLKIAYSKIKKQNLVLINNGTHQRETFIRVTHSTTLNHLVKWRHYIWRHSGPLMVSDPQLLKDNLEAHTV